MEFVCTHVGSRLRASVAVLASATLCVLAAIGGSVANAAAAYRPADRSVVVLRLGDTNVEAELSKQRSAVAQSRNDAVALAKYVRTLASVGARTGNERYYGFAEQALAGAPESVRNALRVVQAQLLQHRHDFKASDAVLSELIELEPRNVDALLMRAQVRMHLLDDQSALSDCAKLRPLVDLLTAATCTAQARSLAAAQRSDVERAYATLSLLLRTEGGSPGARSWSAGVAAELAARLGHNDSATTLYRTSFELDPDSHFARLSYVDWLLSLGERREASIVASNGASAADNLRAVIADGRPHSNAAEQLQLSWREAAARGERSHLRDQARFELDVLEDSARAHASALDNFLEQRSVDDALLLARTAEARADRRALQLVREWQMSRRYFDVRLDRYLASLK